MQPTTPLAFVAAVLAWRSDVDLIAAHLDEVQAEFPGHACAIFSQWPITVFEHAAPPSWKYAAKHYLLNKSTLAVCIPETEHGQILIRKGAGGYTNWNYNNTKFIRFEKMITVR